jgi:CRP-like cAMP-binding protein
MTVISEILELGRPFKAASGEKIFVQGKPARLLYYLISGCVVTCACSANGQEAMIMDVTPGQFLPVTALLGGAVSYIAHGMAQSNCELVAIEITKLRKLVLKDVRISNYFLEIGLQRMERILRQFLDAALLDATGRIAKWLMDVARDQAASLDNGMVIQLNCSTRVVGLATAGMARETISRQLGWLVRERIIDRSKKSVTLLDIARLRALSDGTAIATSKNADIL